MTQSFIPIGQGYSDFFEFEELIHFNASRIHRILLLHTTLEEEPKTSIIVVMKPSRQGNFQAMYAIFEAIPYPYPKSSKRIDFIRQWALDASLTINELEVKAMHHFYDVSLYYNYLIGVLRLQRMIPPL